MDGDSDLCSFYTSFDWADPDMYDAVVDFHDQADGGGGGWD